MSHTFLIVGKSFSSLKESIEDRGDSWLLLKDSKSLKARNENTVIADFGNEDAVFDAIRNITQKIDGVISIYENYILIASKIASKLNLPGLSTESAKACTDKELMRASFLKSNETISPNFAVISTENEALAFAAENAYPLIIKPANLAKSLLVLKCGTEKELINNLIVMKNQIDEVYKKYAPHQKPKIIIEEFLEGTIHSVDAFVESDGTPKVLSQIVDYKTGYDIGYDDNFHYSRVLPSKLSLEDQKNLIHVAQLGCKALGMKSTAAHIEIIMTASGPRIVEIGARNGGYRERMHKLANGIDVLDIQLDLKLGRRVEISVRKQEPCAVLELFPKKSGIFTDIKNRDKLLKLPSLTYFKVKQNFGEYVGKAGDGYKMCVIIILHNSNTKQFDQDIDFINRNVSIITS